MPNHRLNHTETVLQKFDTRIIGNCNNAKASVILADFEI